MAGVIINHIEMNDRIGSPEDLDAVVSTEGVAEMAVVEAEIKSIVAGVAEKAKGWGNRDDNGGSVRQNKLNFAKGDSGSSADEDWANSGRFE